MEVSMIKRYMCCVYILSLFIGASHVGVSAADFKYFVSPDGNDLWNGTNIDQPFATIQKARDIIRNVNKQGHSVTVYLRGGVYQLSETLIFTFEDSGTELYPVTYAAYAREEPIITGGKLRNGLHLDQLVKLEGNPENGKYVEYIVIRGITFSGAESMVTKDEIASDLIISDNTGISMKYAHHCIFKDNNIRNMSIPAFQMTGDENEITGNFICDVIGGAICVQGNNIIIKNNLIRDIHNAGREKPGWGICLDSATKHTTIENNIVVRTGICLYLREKSRDISITNNVFVNGDLSLLKLNNPKDHTHENIRIVRNIFFFMKSDVDLFNISGTRSVPELSDYNIYWNPAGCIWLNPVIWGIPKVAYFKEWQAMGFDTHSIVKDPFFVDVANDDYSLKSKSPALKLGFKPIDYALVRLRTK